VGEIENGCRKRHNVAEINWTEEMAIAMDLFGEKSGGAQSYQFQLSDKFVLYFKTVAYGPLKFLVHADATKNVKSFFYKLIKLMDEDCEVNKDIAANMVVSKVKFLMEGKEEEK
jgi:hypothetical protein